MRVGSTLLFPRERDWSRPEGPISIRVNVFIGLSATLGVVWCTAWTLSAELGSDAYWSVQHTLGDDKFIAHNMGHLPRVIDNTGRVLAVLHPPVNSSLSIFGFWLSNRKWLVKVAPATSEGSMLVVWKMSSSGGLPVGSGVGVKCPVRMYGCGARFSQFDPLGDELVAVGSSKTVGGEFISFINLDQSVEAGVSVMTKTDTLPFSCPSDLLWAAPDGILTIHQHFNTVVFNKKTGKSHVFCCSDGKYRTVACIPPAHISALLRDIDHSNGNSTTTEVYSCSSSSDLIHPSHLIQRWDTNTVCQRERRPGCGLQQ
ncbi:hypothetical protein Pelo_19167 [Pelomyxa schiedti]|nr:hypothetical protein Pelo_19167 [Pelomyxa schiedti]